MTKEKIYTKEELTELEGDMDTCSKCGTTEGVSYYEEEWVNDKQWYPVHLCGECKFNTPR